MLGITAMISLPILFYIALSAKPGHSYITYIITILVIIAINLFAAYIDHIIENRRKDD